MKALLLSLSLILSALPLAAQSGAAGRVASELVESLAKRGSSQAAAKSSAELAQLGGTKAVQEILEAAQREGGDALMRRIAATAEQHGVVALSALRGAPGTVIRAVDQLPQDLAANGLRALASEPAAVSRMVSEFGPAALETAARHPGLAPSLASRLGTEGLDVARSLSTDQAILLSRHADSLASLPAAERSAFLSFIRSSPARSLAWIEKHPRLLLAGSGTAAVIAARKEIFGDGEQRGFLERSGAALYSTFQQPANLVAGGLAAAVLAWASIHLWGTWRHVRKRSAQR